MAADPHGTPIQLTQRFDAFVRFLGSKGGEVAGLGHEDLADQITAFWGEPMRVNTLRTVIARAKKVGVIHVRTHSSYIGVGRAPDSYHLRFPIEEWPQRRANLEAAHTAARQAAAAQAQRTRERKAAQSRAERARERAVVERAWPPPPKTATAPLPPPPAPEPEAVAVEELDVEAWAWAGDF